MELLLVEDEPAIAQPLAALLNNHGWRVRCVSRAAEALACIQNAGFDAALIDLGLPDGSGLSVCRALRAKSDAAILILTARSDEESVVRCLAEGADDYIAKPFRARELVERLNAVQRRRGGAFLYRLGNVTADSRSAQVTCEGVHLPLTAQEYRLLLMFITHPGQVLERGQLLQTLWDECGNFVNDNTLTVTVKRLREKLAAADAHSFITTVRGIGYRMEAQSYEQP